MPMICYVLNRLCRAMYRGDYRRLMRVSDVKSVQHEKLFDILSKNKDTLHSRKIIAMNDSKT